VGSFPRQCVFAGTANPDSYLTDPTGGRRYWPVRCGERIRLGPLQQARDQLWAEALHRWRAGEHWWPERQEWAAFGEEQAQRYQEDPWEEIIERYLNAPAVCNQHYCTVAEVLREALKFETARIQGGDGQRVGRILQRLGWQKARLMVTLDGERRRRNLYQRPEAPPSAEVESGEEPPAHGGVGRSMH
jgi:putative DNA primase/helicase